MNKHDETNGPSPVQEQVTLRGPAELADALPYLLGFHPTNSVVMVALHGVRGRFGGRLRLGIPRSPQEWQPVADQLADGLVTGSESRGRRPEGIIVFLCQDPGPGETPADVMERLRPFAQHLRTACGARDVPVPEALCISDGRFFSYCCPDTRCCPSDGNAMALPGTSVMAAAAAYAGIQVRGSLQEMEARLTPWQPPRTAAQERALDEAAGALVPRILAGADREQVGQETLDTARRLVRRIGRTPQPPGWAEADTADDALITDDEAALVLLGLQDRTTRDRAAEWMEGPSAASVVRLWRALARRCVGPYAEYAAAPLTLAGWVAWSTGDEPGARVALGRALALDPEYIFARLLHQACNEGLDPEALRHCLRRERSSRVASGKPPALSGRRTSPKPPGARQDTLPGTDRPGPPAGRGRSRRRTGQRGSRTGR
ncbi:MULTISPECIES: DUF4192 domain-containing protein [unclassified Streptomyces]|uniref:DUF4192 domain-containing protein n=1 Tax=unclassified Streptomyces TaxID=2593676 RepID=UPI002E0E08BA|nr:DUF4192 domain-containing protein [Streptomyces sp. NBC_01197]WSS53761.1 DUF4192 domain-containing protein [Streptomyces sp. NBC_01180]